MEKVLQDLRLATRLLVKNPGFSAVIILTLGLGIGANTAIFSLVNAVLLRPLPYPAPEQLVVVRKDWKPYWRPSGEVSPFLDSAEILAWQEQNTVLSQMAVYARQGRSLTGTEEAELVGCFHVSGSFLPAFGVAPGLGRGFLPDECRPGAAPVAILSHDLWQRQFGGLTNILGRTILLDEKPYTVVGVLPAAFKFIEWSTDVLVPLLEVKNAPGLLQVIGRLKPGVSLAQAQAGLDIIYQAARDPKATGRVVLTGLHEHVTRHSRLSLLIYLGAVAFVLLIACANVANLLLARGAGRRKEMAIRIALGAGRVRILGQLLTESVLLALAAGLVGLLLAFWGKSLLGPLIGNLPRMQPIGIDIRVLLFTLLIALLTGILFGLAPALEACRLSVGDSLKEGTRSGGAGGLRQHRLSRLLVVGEVTLALVLLLGAGLLVKSFLRLRGVDLGFRPDRILSLRIDLSKRRYPNKQAQAAYFEQVIERIRRLPAVEAVGLDAALPLSGYSMSIATQRDRESPRHFRAGVVNADYFRTMSIPLKKGRLFTDEDRAGKPSVALVNESFARTHFPDTDPVGKQIMDATIVGVVGDVRQGGPADAPEPLLYLCYLQQGGQSMSLAVRTRTDPSKLAGAVRGQIVGLDRDQPIHGLATLEQRLAENLSPRRLNMLLSSALGVVALLLVAVGVYGVLSFSVAQRTHEIGVRMALGAQTGDVLRLVVGEGLKLTLAGVLLGLLAGFWLTRFLTSLLWGVSALDPTIYLGVSLFLGMVGLLACYLPARKAASVDPMVALRDE